jgi:uncharacterized integral membrane protein
MAGEPSDKPPSTGPERPLSERARLYGGIIAAGALLLFLLQNLQQATIHFLWFDWEIALILALFLAALAGAGATWLLTTFRWRRGREQE